MRMLRLKDLTLAFVFLNYYGQPILSGWFQFLVSPPSPPLRVAAQRIFYQANLYFGKLLVSLLRLRQSKWLIN